jgi:Predicted Zn-dependent proteases and their inactivated homologs
MLDADRSLSLLDSLLADALRQGADAADAVLIDQQSLNLSWRLGKQETIERSEGVDIGLRVLIGRRQAMVSSSDLSEDAGRALVERAVAMARIVPEDPYCGLADAGQVATTIPDVDGCDPVAVDVPELQARAAAAEAAALAVAGVTNSEGADAGWGISRVAIAATNGLARSFARSWHSVSVSVLAGNGTAMERDYDYASTVYGADLPDPAALGRSAGEQAVHRLNPHKIGSVQVPVVYAPRVARSLLGHLAGAINGQSVARGTTFLKDKMGAEIFAPGISIIDDPLRPRGLRSGSVDVEGIASRRLPVIDQGVLTTWLLELRSARQLGLPPTGHASRGIASPPSATASNFYLAPGQLTPAQLIADAGTALYVTDLMGSGVNGITGDYSRGASGFWIEGGEITYPVSEITVSGNLLEMFRRLTPANDLEFRYGLDAPTVRVDGMTIAGR